MSIKDLETAGLLLPREQWGRYDVHSRVNRAGVIAAWITAVLSAVLIYVGNGCLLTWVGLAGMAVFLVLFTYLSIHAINVRNQASAHVEGGHSPQDEDEAGEAVSEQ